MQQLSRTPERVLKVFTVSKIHQNQPAAANDFNPPTLAPTGLHQALARQEPVDTRRNRARIAATRERRLRIPFFPAAATKGPGDASKARVRWSPCVFEWLCAVA